MYQPPNKRNFEDMVVQFMQTTQQHQQATSQMILELQQQMTKMNATIGILQQEKGKFPAQPQPNPKGQNSVGTSSGEEKNLEQVKSITTLRSGKVLDKTIIPHVRNQDVNEEKKEEKAENSEKDEKIVWMLKKMRRDTLRHLILKG